MKNPPIYVTKPSLPSREKTYSMLEGIWDRSILTSSGLWHELETSLYRYLDVPYISLFSNGTTALRAALAVPDLLSGSEIIATPFTFIATANPLSGTN